MLIITFSSFFLSIPAGDNMAENETAEDYVSRKYILDKLHWYWMNPEVYTNILTHFSPVSYFYTPCKRQKT